MALLSKNDIESVDDLKHEDVPVPQWGGSVRVRVMSGTERDAFRTFMATFDGGAPVCTLAAALIVYTCVDETGARMYALEEVDAIKEKSAAALDAIANVAMRLNGLGMNSVPDAAKNSESSQSGDSGSASPKS